MTRETIEQAIKNIETGLKRTNDLGYCNLQKNSEIDKIIEFYQIAIYHKQKAQEQIKQIEVFANYHAVSFDEMLNETCCKDVQLNIKRNLSNANNALLIVISNVYQIPETEKLIRG